MHTQAPTLVYCKHTHTHTHTGAHRRSLLINTASILFPHRSAKHATHHSRAPGVHPSMCPVHTLTRSCARNLHTAPRCTAAPGARGLWTRGRDVSVRKEAFWAQWFGRPQGAPGLQRPRGSRLLLWPGQDGRNSTGCPSLHHETVRGEHLGTRPGRTLTELSPCFCLPPPPEGDASDGSRLPVVSVTAAGTQSCPPSPCNVTVRVVSGKGFGRRQTDAPIFRTKNILSQISFLFLYIYIFCCRFNISTSLV